jgi:hypothetical protein
MSADARGGGTHGGIVIGRPPHGRFGARRAGVLGMEERR